MEKISTIGLDIAKQVFQVHGVNDQGQVVVQKRLRRAEVLIWFEQLEPCLIGIESCATSTYWAQEISKFGHKVRLIPPIYVKPYVRRQKNDRTDAAAICEAVSRPSMRFVAIKTVEQQSVQTLHRTRELLISQQTQAINALRAHIAEYGMIFPQKNPGVMRAIEAVRDQQNSLPAFVRQCLHSLIDQIDHLRKEINKLDRQMTIWHRANADSQRLATIPGVGVITATAILASIGDGKQFRSGREFAASIGLVPNQNSSGGKERLGHISKKGNAYLRTLLILGATAMLVKKYRTRAAGGMWFLNLLERKPARVATVALANKMARVAWAILTKGSVYVADDVTASTASMMAAVG